MDVEKEREVWQDFFENKYLKEIGELLTKKEQFLVVDFNDIVRFNYELSNTLLDNPRESLKIASAALNSINKQLKDVKVRIKNLPKICEVRIRDIRSRHIGKLISIKGVVRQKSDVRPQVIAAKFECPSCGNIITVIQTEKKFREPTKCNVCGRKSRFRLLDKDLVDAQGLVIEESAYELEGGEQPKRINVFLRDDLVSPLSEKKTNPGNYIRINGILEEVPISARDGGKLTRFDLMIEANYLEPLEEDFSSTKLTDEDIERIKELSKDPNLMEKLVASLAPGIYGHKEIKKALLFQFVGGVPKIRSDGVKTRGDIHILLVGDPGSGKSQLLKRAQVIAPKARYVTGKGVTGAGLTASVVRDEFLSGWSLEAGALVLASDGICMIDELDKMSSEDRDAMHEALEQQTVTISKANIFATLRAETTVLAAANPKFGRFDPFEPIAKQINLPAALINRFDLIFPVKDMPDKTKDEKLAEFVLKLHQKHDVLEPPISTELLKKYLTYARREIKPRLTNKAIERLKEFFVKMRLSGQEEGGVKSVPISTRQLEALIRLAEASAKIRLSDKVEEKDALEAIRLLTFCLLQVGVDPETGKIDIDRISTGITASERSRLIMVREIIEKLEERFGKTIPLESIIEEASLKGIDGPKVEEILEKLKRSGDVFEPRRGFIQRI